MEEQEKVKVYTVGKLVNATLIEGLLAENGIKSYILNKRDSQFLFGDIEIYVDSKDAEAAKKLIDSRPQN